MHTLIPVQLYVYDVVSYMNAVNRRTQAKAHPDRWWLHQLVFLPYFHFVVLIFYYIWSLHVASLTREYLDNKDYLRESVCTASPCQIIF